MRVFCEKIPRVDMTAAISVAVVAKSLVANLLEVGRRLLSSYNFLCLKSFVNF